MSNENIGAMIKDKRLALGLTLEEVGDEVGVGKSTVRKWENGLIKNMGRDKVAALAKVLGLSPAQLIQSDYIDETEAASADQQILFRLAKNAKPEAIRAAVAVLKSMEGENDDI